MGSGIYSPILPGFIVVNVYACVCRQSYNVFTIPRRSLFSVCCPTVNDTEPRRNSRLENRCRKTRAPTNNGEELRC